MIKMLISFFIKYILSTNIKHNKKTFENGFITIFITFCVITATVLTIITLVLTKGYGVERKPLLYMLLPIIYIIPYLVNMYIKKTDLVDILKIEVDNYTEEEQKKYRTLGLIVGLFIGSLPLLTMIVVNVLDKSGAW